VTIPATIDGLTVTSIASGAFIENEAVTNVIIPNTVTSIGQAAFWECFYLTSVTIGTNVTSIGQQAFEYCEDLTSVTIPASVTSMGDYAFGYCYYLTSAYFEGNAPPDDGTIFQHDSGGATVYYQSGTTGWTSTFGSVPTVLFRPVLSITLVSLPGTTTSSAVISWPSPSTGFVLQQNSNPSTTNWTNSGFLINDNGTTRWVSNSPATGSLFFRLNNP
jgi:hypothetical protein